MYLIGALLWAIVIGYVSLSRFLGTFTLFGVAIELPHWRMAFVQVALATLDVAVTAAIMYQLLPDAPGLTFVRFLGVYLSSYTAGLAANIPGGLGVFDTAMLLGLEPYISRAPHPGRDRRVPAVLLHYPAIHRRDLVLRQRDPAAGRSAFPPPGRARRSQAGGADAH